MVRVRVRIRVGVKTQYCGKAWEELSCHLM